MSGRVGAKEERWRKNAPRPQRLLDSKPEINNVREPQSHGDEEEVTPVQQLCEQECRTSLGQENPEPSLVKEEQEEIWVTKEVEQLPGLASDTEDFLLTSPCVRTVFDQVLPQPQIKTEPDGEGYGGPGPTSDSLLLSVVNPDSTDGVESCGLLQSELKPLKLEMKTEPQSHGSEEELTPGQQLCEQECRISLGQENPDSTLVKEEEEEFWVTPKEEQHPGLASDREDFVLPSPCVRPVFFLPQPVLYLIQTVENRETTPCDSQLATAAQIKTEGYGGPGPTSDSPFLSVVNPVSADGGENSGLLQSVLKFPCNECGKCFTLKSDLNQHMRMHPGTKRFKCKECGKCFKMKHHLNQHMIIHTGDKPFKCKECDKCFKMKHHLNQHMRTHTGDKPFKCKECDKCFNMKCNLDRHMMIHTGDKPFKCNECGKCFNMNCTLNRHMRICSVIKKVIIKYEDM